MKAIVSGLVVWLFCSPLAAQVLSSQGVEATPSQDLNFPVSQANAGVQFRLSEPDGRVENMSFQSYEEVRFGIPLVDGLYHWEMVLSPQLSSGVQREVTRIDPNNREEFQRDLRRRGLLPDGADQYTYGSFTILNGQLVVEQPEKGSKGVAGSTKDQVFLDDIIVDGSACIGFDCVNGESFGFDTLRLKENNLRVKFQDTSSSASFPSNDWQLTANDSSNGGANKFSIDDIDGGRTPFTIEASAPSNSLYVDDRGKIGFGTSTPVTEMHSTDGDTPTLRLEQNGSSGFTPQTWDIAGNETNFFIRDATNGSKLPFKIRPSAPTNSIYVDTDGSIGFGTSSPSAFLHARQPAVGSDPLLRLDANTFTALTVGQDGSTGFGVASPSAYLHANQPMGSTGPLLQLDANGTTALIVNNNGSIGIGTSTPLAAIHVANTSQAILLQLDGNTPSAALTVANNGDLTTQGSLIELSSVTSKENFALIDPAALLKIVADLTVSTWNYKHQSASSRHIGPMAEDFYAAFQFGTSNKSVRSGDVASVALAAVKALQNKLADKEQRIDALEQRLLNLETQLGTQ